LRNPFRAWPDVILPVEFFAALWLWLEAILRWLAPVFALSLIWITFVLWGGLEKLATSLQYAIVILFYVISATFLLREFRRVLWPNTTRIKTRLEQAGNLSHQPLQTLDDAPMRRSSLSDALWQQHQLQSAKLLSQLRWPKLRANYAARDSRALRWLFILLALLGALQAPALAWPRLVSAFFPGNFNALAAFGPGQVYLYFIPPAQTNQRPIYLNNHGKKLSEKLILPAGTTLWARVAGGTVKPALRLSDEEKKFSRLQDDFFVLQTRLNSGSNLQIRQGFLTLFNLPIELQPAMPPVIKIEKITLMPKAEMQIKLCATDQYGLHTVIFHWRGQEYPELQSEHSIAIQEKSFCQNVTLDMASDVLAGQPVEFWASATNSMNLTQQSGPQVMPLPHMEFQNPLAANLAVARQDYALHHDKEKLLQALSNLRRISLPVGLFLATENVQQQIAVRDDDLRSVILANLWQIILRLEEGKNADIAANWRAARNDLMENLQDWRVSENTLLNLLNHAFQAWQDNLQSQEISPNGQTQLWQQMAAWISSGQRPLAAAILVQLEQYPYPVMQSEKLETDEVGTAALQAIRARLANPNLSSDERTYLNRLIESK